MSNSIVLSSSIRSNLVALQNTAEMQAKVQDRLATGKKVGSALDNPTNFFTAAGLNRRASDLSALLDGMQQGIKTLEAADNAMKAITKTVETMQANLRQARQDKSFKGTSYTLDANRAGNLSFSGGAVGTTLQSVTPGHALQLPLPPPAAAVPTSPLTLDLSALNGQSLTITAATGGFSATYTFTNSATGQTAALEAALETSGFVVARTSGGLTISRADGIEFTVDSSNNAVATAIGIADNTTTTNGTEAVRPSLDGLVSTINADVDLVGKVKASNDGGKLRIENLSTEVLNVTGVSGSDGEIDGGVGTTTIAGNDVRKGLMSQFNELRSQLDKLAGDATYNGVNLLRADKLKIVFNELNTSSIDIQAKNTTGAVRGISTDPNSLDLGLAMPDEFSNDSNLEARLEDLSQAIITLQAQASAFGANLTTVQTRQEFTKAMINTLQSGADQLTLADANEEGANLLALNTRQQLSQTALSLASQASQAVLRLFG